MKWVHNHIEQSYVLEQESSVFKRMNYAARFKKKSVSTEILQLHIKYCTVGAWFFFSACVCVCVLVFRFFCIVQRFCSQNWAVCVYSSELLIVGWMVQSSMRLTTNTQDCKNKIQCIFEAKESHAYTYMRKFGGTSVSVVLFLSPNVRIECCWYRECNMM